MIDGFQIDTAAMTELAGGLDTVGQDTFAHAASLQVAPDAGASSAVTAPVV